MSSISHVLSATAKIDDQNDSTKDFLLKLWN